MDVDLDIDVESEASAEGSAQKSAEKKTECPTIKDHSLPLHDLLARAERIWQQQRAMGRRSRYPLFNCAQAEAFLRS